MPFFYRCFIKFYHFKPWKTSKTWRKHRCFKGRPFSYRSCFWSKNLQKWLPTSIKIRSNIDQNNDLKKYRILIEQMTPKRPQNGPQNRPPIDFGANVAPKRGPTGSKRASETEFGRFLIDFGPIWDRFGIELGPISDRFATIFLPNSKKAFHDLESM